jgi:hypothetical protein
VRSPDHSPLVQLLFRAVRGGEGQHSNNSGDRGGGGDNSGGIVEREGPMDVDDDAVEGGISLGTTAGVDEALSRLQALHSRPDLRAALLHTRYHAVPKLESIAPLAAKW